MVSDEVLIEDQSHYEVSLTAGQAFVAFVLLLLSLAASFAFGLMIGKGQGEDRLVVRKEPAVINEGSVAANRKNDSKLIDLGVGNDDFKAPAAAPKVTAAEPVAVPPSTITEGTVTPLTDATAGTSSSAIVEAPKPVAATPKSEPKPVVVAPKSEPKPVAPAVVPTGPAYAQLLVTGDQKTADALAAKAIDHGFMSTFVERAGSTFKVRVKFASEAEARANEPKLKDLSKDVWIVK
jgi:hypothetical protein